MLASGVTAIAGFAVLVVSDIAMLRDFGFVTVVDLGVSLLGVLVVLPAVLVAGRAPRRTVGAGGRPARARRATRRGAGAPRPRRVVIGGDGRDGARFPRGRTGSTYWLVGVVAFAAIVYVLLGTLRAERGRPAGPAVGTTLPPFAAPLATSRLEGDVNVARRDGQGQAGAGRPAPSPARTCSRRAPLARRGPVVLAFFTAGASRCVDELDVLDRVARRHPDVQVAAVALRGDRAVAAAARPAPPVVASRSPRTATGSWPTSTASSVCPHLTFADRGGRVRGRCSASQNAHALERRFADLERRGTAR